jgi:uncharacterized damage-inducible protein DinB
MTPSSNDVALEFIRETRGQFQYNFKRILHCLDQLKEEDLTWRPHESANSIQTIILHLCGNLRQWILHSLGGEPDVRNRPQEFADRQPIPKIELIAQLKQVFDEVDAILGVLPTDRLLEPRRIQGYEMSVLGAIMDTITHFIGHTHQVVYITRMRLGDSYRFFWVPENPEQMASR